MADILTPFPESAASWPDEVRMVLQNDPVRGGPEGAVNVALQALVNRTKYLKQTLNDTKAELEKQIGQVGGTGIIVLAVIIPATGWAANSGDYAYRVDVANDSLTADMIPMLSIAPDSLDVAAACGFCPTCEIVAGALRVYAQTMPEEAITASLTAITSKGGGGYAALQIATKSTLGAIKVGEGLDIQQDGTLSVSLVDEEQAKEDIETSLDGNEA